MGLTQKEVEKIAELARLELAEEERESFRDQISSILEYVGKLSEVDVADVEPMSHAFPVTNVLREDCAESCPKTEREAVMASFPEREGDLLKVKAIFE